METRATHPPLLFNFTHSLTHIQTLPLSMSHTNREKENRTVKHSVFVSTAPIPCHRSIVFVKPLGRDETEEKVTKEKAKNKIIKIKKIQYRLD